MRLGTKRTTTAAEETKVNIVYFGVTTTARVARIRITTRVCLQCCVLKQCVTHTFVCRHRYVYDGVRTTADHRPICGRTSRVAFSSSIKRKPNRILVCVCVWCAFVFRHRPKRGRPRCVGEIRVSGSGRNKKQYIYIVVVVMHGNTEINRFEN